MNLDLLIERYRFQGVQDTEGCAVVGLKKKLAHQTYHLVLRSSTRLCFLHRVPVFLRRDLIL